MSRPVAAIILAAGKGIRMKSDLHKVLHPIAGQPMLAYLLASLAELQPARTIVVIGDKGEQVEPVVAAHGGEIVVQQQQQGTADAVRQAETALSGFDGDVLILYADTPFVTAATMRAMIGRLAEVAGAVVVASRPADPKHYGRILAEPDGTILKMVEYKDASEEERSLDLCNSGLMAVRSAELWPLLARVGRENAAQEYYLPDIVMIAARDGHASAVIEVPADEVEGINSRAELAAQEAAWQARRRTAMMAEGVSLVAPETVWFSHDTSIGRDCLVEPNVVFGPGVTVGARVTVKAFSHIEGATIADDAQIGPFARLRPGAEIGEGARIGNFVEVKQAKLGPGAKASHLSYLGDAEIGAGANIGAGTITCNYDGFFKYKTWIGEGAFIGSNTALVAPVMVGKGALVAAGSVITRDVPEDAVALARGVQVEKAGAAAKYRARMQAKKKAM
jgi:bifunctional UDP-N-acetylglucosamine pyrophosphorylase/glucosamine-1-phosphate N-acetyltransferase